MALAVAHHLEDYDSSSADVVHESSTGITENGERLQSAIYLVAEKKECRAVDEVVLVILSDTCSYLA